MERRELGISILFLTVIVSGCIGPSGQQTQQSSGKALTVSGPSIQPSSGTIREDSSVRVSMGVMNTGEMNGTLVAGRNGDQIMTNYCTDVFEITDYEAQSSQTMDAQESYSLNPDWEAQFNWELQQTGDVPIMGQTCELRFEAPFNYSVDAYRQLQIKRSAEAGGEPQLTSQSSKGPLAINIELIGSSSEQGAPVFIEEDSIEVLVRFSKKQSEDSPYQGLIDISNPELEAKGIDIDRDSCEIPEQIIMYEGDSQVIRCDLDYGGSIGSPSITPQISVNADYKYTKDVPSRTVEVEYSGE